MFRVYIILLLYVHIKYVFCCWSVDIIISDKTDDTYEWDDVIPDFDNIIIRRVHSENGRFYKRVIVTGRYILTFHLDTTATPYLGVVFNSAALYPYTGILGTYYKYRI